MAEAMKDYRREIVFFYQASQRGVNCRCLCWKSKCSGKYKVKLILTLMLISPKMTTREMIPNAFIRYF